MNALPYQSLWCQCRKARARAWRATAAARIASPTWSSRPCPVARARGEIQVRGGKPCGSGGEGSQSTIIVLFRRQIESPVLRHNSCIHISTTDRPPPTDTPTRPLHVLPTITRDGAIQRLPQTIRFTSLAAQDLALERAPSTERWQGRRQGN